MSDVTALPNDDDPGAWIGWTTIQQAIASDPLRSAWVSANAGSGKTHVLTQRVIRLLLAGARPSAILCLTYTKAAASEMSNRVFERLADWVVLDDEDLSRRITQIEGTTPDGIKLAARVHEALDGVLAGELLALLGTLGHGSGHRNDLREARDILRVGGACAPDEHKTARNHGRRGGETNPGQNGPPLRGLVDAGGFPRLTGSGNQWDGFRTPASIGVAVVYRR